MSGTMTSRSVIRLAVNCRAWKPTEWEWTLAAQCVQKEEKERIGKFVFKKDSKPSMIGRLLIRRVLADMTGRDFINIRLRRTDKGKPFLEPAGSGEDFHGSFNVAHHGDFAVLAADAHHAVGTDVMKVEHRKDIRKFFSTLRRQLTEQEWLTVERQEGDRDKMAMFYRFWCLKESYVKAIGTGIGFEVSRLDFHVSTEKLSMNRMVRDTSVYLDGKKQTDWLFEETMLDADHCVAIATNIGATDTYKESQDSRSFEFLTAVDLLSRCRPLVGSQPDPEYWAMFSARQESPMAQRS
ncbi:L-aminoadipate-semialdehyde dehydrogenase-phosphopantetheinyl transferase-like [Haliotis cracherodii]|uniref:L-aminoadipate-semialdehyde dehydrogenase-phosphopantetheinyl transferase-like n=1 Tax=Haliotis cracherodii TaxID=6455 RepID=UPI0039E86EA9